jgi:hypothetical protein
MFVQLGWQKSSFSGMEDNNNCLEIASFSEGVALRESEEPEVVLSTTQARLAALLASVQQSGSGR